MLKNFEDFLNESEEKMDWKQKLEVAKKYMTKERARRLGLASPDAPLDTFIAGIWKCILDGKIYGQPIPPYPCIIAVSGTGDDMGNDRAWLIQNQEDFFRWIFTESTHNKSFPDCTGEGYNDPVETWDEDVLEDMLEEIRDLDNSDSNHGDGYRVDIFRNEEDMKEVIADSIQCPDCQGSGEHEDGEECEYCEGSGETPEDNVEYRDILDGDYFPDRELTRQW